MRTVSSTDDTRSYFPALHEQHILHLPIPYQVIPFNRALLYNMSFSLRHDDGVFDACMHPPQEKGGGSNPFWAMAIPATYVRTVQQ